MVNLKKDVRNVVTFPYFGKKKKDFSIFMDLINAALNSVS